LQEKIIITHIIAVSQASAMKIHELLPPEAIRLDFAPSPGQELPSSLWRASGSSGASIEACQFQEDELHLINEYMSESLGILHNLSEAVDKPLLVLARIGGDE
jgi:hypothetical protein